MRRTHKRKICISAGVLLFFCAHHLLAQEQKPLCPGKDKKMLASAEGSADVVANASLAEGSLRFESKRLLGLVDKELGGEDVEVPLLACDEALPKVARLRISPRQYLRDDKEQKFCQAFEEKTLLKPLRYHPEEKNTMKGIRKWFTQFSQGENRDGIDLYERCSGHCSPQYTLYLFREGKKYRIIADVVCGKPRDKYDNYYLLGVDMSYCCVQGMVAE